MTKKFTDEKIHIVYAADNKFAEIMGISLISLFECNKDIADIQIYILDSGIHDTNREKVESIFKKYCRQMPRWISARNIAEELGMSIDVDRGSLSQYARLFISRDLPSYLKRVIYLDCDIIVNKSLQELWNLDLHGKTIGALRDAFSKYYRRNIDLKPQDIMFNSGVMVVDLELWRLRQVEKRLLQFIISKKGKIQQGDQGALNSVLCDEVYCFEPRFNAVSIFFDFTYEEMLKYRKPPEYYCKSEIMNAINDPVIIHFTTSFLSVRPWIEGCKHKYVSRWLQYKNLSPWQFDPLWKDSRSRWKKIALRMFRALPRNCAISIASFLQVYARPMCFRMRQW